MKTSEQNRLTLVREADEYMQLYLSLQHGINHRMAPRQVRDNGIGKFSTGGNQYGDPFDGPFDRARSREQYNEVVRLEPGLSYQQALRVVAQEHGLPSQQAHAVLIGVQQAEAKPPSQRTLKRSICEALKTVSKEDTGNISVLTMVIASSWVGAGKETLPAIVGMALLVWRMGTNALCADVPPLKA